VSDTDADDYSQRWLAWYRLRQNRYQGGPRKKELSHTRCVTTQLAIMHRMGGCMINHIALSARGNELKSCYKGHFGG